MADYEVGYGKPPEYARQDGAGGGKRSREKGRAFGSVTLTLAIGRRPSPTRKSARRRDGLGLRLRRARPSGKSR
jgi:hypothetical protein